MEPLEFMHAARSRAQFIPYLRWGWEVCDVKSSRKKEILRAATADAVESKTGGSDWDDGFPQTHWVLNSTLERGPGLWLWLWLWLVAGSAGKSRLGIACSGPW